MQFKEMIRFSFKTLFSCPQKGKKSNFYLEHLPLFPCLPGNRFEWR
jgi:hypothetical protein